jgi:hypothetical protein
MKSPLIRGCRTGHRVVKNKSCATLLFHLEENGMTDINDWLDENSDNFLGQPTFSEDKSDFRDAAKALTVQAQAAGYSVEEVKDACGGDVESFLMKRQNLATDAAMQQSIADDPYGD